MMRNKEKWWIAGILSRIPLIVKPAIAVAPVSRRSAPAWKNLVCSLVENILGSILSDLTITGYIWRWLPKRLDEDLLNVEPVTMKRVGSTTIVCSTALET